MMHAIARTIVLAPCVLTFISLFCQLLLVPVSIAFAKHTDSEADPLRSANTSSPRDILLSFLSDSNQDIENFRQDKRTDETYRAFRRASQALGFSSTPERAG